MALSLPRLLALGALALAGLAAPAAAVAAAPTMKLGDVRGGMRCTGYSVIRGIDPAAFDVEILDVVEGEAAVDGPRLLVRVSGPAVDVTGVGPGFSGSPVYCPDAQGTARVAGAISESVGEYGGKVALATPIQAILGVPVDAPAATPSRHVASRPLAAPLTVSGLDPALARSVQAAARRAGRTLLAAPSSPLTGFPRRTLRPGSAMAVSLASGDLSLSAIGTVAYVDEDRVWSFGHPYEGLGRRSLLLQDAYVYRVINNPAQGGEANSTYKLAAAGHTVGTLTNDGFAAVAGRLGAPPPTVPVTVDVRDLDTNKRRTTRVQAADEVDVGNPTGLSPVNLVSTLAVAQGTSAILGSSPPRLTGEMCARFRLRELSLPLRFCNRYVTDSADAGFFGPGNGVASAASDDVGRALSLIDAFELAPLHVRSVAAQVEIRRGARLARLRSVSLPRRVRPGQRVRVRLRIQPWREPLQTRAFSLRIPRDIGRGSQKLLFRGAEADAGGLEFLDFGLSTAARGAPSRAAQASAATVRAKLESLAMRIAKISRYDGVTLRTGAGSRATPVFRDRRLRIAGRASARVHVTRASRRPGR